MDKIRISVKGDDVAVRPELERRGIPATLVEVGLKREGQCQSFWDVSASLRPKLIEWYCEPSVCAEGTGFPDGTLIHHG